MRFPIWIFLYHNIQHLHATIRSTIIHEDILYLHKSKKSQHILLYDSLRYKWGL